MDTIHELNVKFLYLCNEYCKKHPSCKKKFVFAKTLDRGLNPFQTCRDFEDMGSDQDIHMEYNGNIICVENFRDGFRCYTSNAYSYNAERASYELYK